MKISTLEEALKRIKELEKEAGSNGYHVAYDGMKT